MQPLLTGAAAPKVERGRVHEFCGMARHTLAALLMQADTAPTTPVIWIAPSWQQDRFCPDGLTEYTDPGRLILVAARREVDLLWTMEEALRAGVVGMIFAELTAPPGLTPIRRLQLAAEAGRAQQAGPPPLGVILTPGAGGAAGVESRWQLAPRPDGWHLDRLRARMAPPKAWQIMRQGQKVVICPCHTDPQPAPV